jgi:hypothetical protein
VDDGIAYCLRKEYLCCVVRCTMREVPLSPLSAACAWQAPKLACNHRRLEGGGAGWDQRLIYSAYVETLHTWRRCQSTKKPKIKHHAWKDGVGWQGLLGSAGGRTAGLQLQGLISVHRPASTSFQAYSRSSCSYRHKVSPAWLAGSARRCRPQSIMIVLLL